MSPGAVGRRDHLNRPEGSAETKSGERARAEQLLNTINHAAVAMELALNPDEMFAAIGEEFGKVGFTCLILSASEDQTRLYTRYLSLDSSQVAAAEQLVGIVHERFSFPIKDVDVSRRVVGDRDTVFIEDAEDVTRQVLPPSARKLARKVIKLVGSSRAIVAPLVVQGEVIGTLSVLSDDLTHADMPAITAFANQLAAAWRRTRLVQDLERSLEELKETQSKLLKAQRMEAIGRLAGGVAHDFNNLLTIIKVNAELLKQQLHPTDPLWECAQQILEASERAARLTRQLLRFSSSEVVMPASSDLGHLVREIGPTLGRILGEEHELAVSLADDLWAVKADPTHLEQVIVNLALNARDAMPHGGCFSIEATNLVPGGRSAADDIEVQPGQYVLLRVCDNGTGMTDAVREHLFEPFFTTKEQGHGTGMGLSTVYGIVKQCGGDISVQTEVGQGTAFNIYLPRHRDAEVQPAERVAGLPPDTTRGWETILLVEDEVIVRELAVQILQAGGYQILEAENGAEALRIAAGHRAPIHLLLTDVVMPGMSGPELADQLRRQHSGICVLFMSGHDGNLVDREDVASGDSAFLPKPFSAETLKLRVRQALDKVQ